MKGLRIVTVIATLVLGSCGGADGESERAQPSARLSAMPSAELSTTLPLDLRATLSAESAPLLGEVQFALDLFVGEGVELAVSFEPALPKGFQGELARPGDTEILDTEIRGVWQRYLWTLQPVEIGTLTIGPYEVRDASGEHVATTRAFELRVASLLEAAESAVESDAEAVEAPGELFEPRFELARWLTICGAILIGLLLLFCAWRLFARRAARTERDSVPLPPHVRALRALAALREAPRRTAAEIESFYVAVSHVLRVYLEERFGLRAPERTTEEFLPELEQSGVLDATQRMHLRQFLEQCDLVKFAAVRPGESVHDATFAFAEELVESTRADRIAAVREVAAEGAA